MGLNLDYVGRETFRNLRRNLTLGIASIITVAVSLALLGVAMLIRVGVDNATARWQDGVEFIVFMNPDADPAQDALVRDSLDQNPEIERWRYVDQAESYEEFRQMFADSPEMVETVTPEVLPPSYRVVPVDASADAVDTLVSTFRTKPGVNRVVSAADTIRKLQQVTELISLWVLVAAVVLMVAAGVLILNTIRMAMFARRREIEVMKLVGATNSFIRVPFMVEGLVQGIAGAALAVGGVVGFNWGLDRLVTDDGGLALLQNFVVDSSTVWTTSIWIMLLGGLVGAIGSGLAISRFLDV